MPALPFVEVVARLAEMAANATDLLPSPTLPAESSGTPTITIASTPYASQTASPTTLYIPEQKLINFAAYIMMQGIFLGMSIIFIYQAIELWLPRRSWLTFANITQLCVWITRVLIIIVFNISPYYQVDCAWRQYGAGAVSQMVIICVWWLQFIKFQSMYKNRPWVTNTVLVLCIVATAATFPYIKTVVSFDALNHCAVKFDSGFQAVYISTDVFINLLLSTLFMAAVLTHVNNTDKSWDSYTKMSYILSCDVRGAFLDTFAQLIKLFLQLAWWLPTSQTIYGIHLCDFLKVVAAHWFVNDVVKNMGAHSSAKGSKNTAGNKNPNASVKGAAGTSGGQAVILASCRRKGSFGTKVAQYFKGDGGGDVEVGSTDTLRIPVPMTLSLESLEATKAAGGGLRAGGKSSENLRVGAVSPVPGSPAMRHARSSDQVNMFPKREGDKKV
ncbi:hypothetical protein HDU98_006029 [Podochytrium sp. JEL0797]|nr:hypothetical protein HDU98_006029 [Podochytrium sp. JEL0797]